MKPFCVGDKVKAFGVRGVVEDTNINTTWAVVVTFETGNIQYFLSDGRISVWHKLPTLKHVKFKPKKKLVPHWPAVDVLSGNVYYATNILFKNIQDAKKYLGVTVVRLSTEYPPVMLPERETK